MQDGFLSFVGGPLSRIRRRRTDDRWQMTEGRSWDAEGGKLGGWEAMRLES